jgi:hypothetical protein
MFDWVVVDVIEVCPKAAFIADAGIPIRIPDAPLLFFIEQIQLTRGTSIQSFHESADIPARFWKE